MANDRPGSVSVERTIAAAPETMWDLVSDITQMGRWSPETQSCEWVGGASAPAVGASFRGRNQNGKKRWTTRSTVTAAEPGRVFGFAVTAGPMKVAHWEYRIEPVDGGCRVTETWTDRRSWLLLAVGKPITGVEDRAVHNRATMEVTLERLAEAAERAGEPTGG